MSKKRKSKSEQQPAVGPSEDEWKARNDSDTMKQAEMIRMDTPRLKKAVAFMAKESKAADAALAKAGFSLKENK